MLLAAIYQTSHVPRHPLFGRSSGRAQRRTRGSSPVGRSGPVGAMTRPKRNANGPETRCLQVAPPHLQTHHRNQTKHINFSVPVVDSQSDRTPVCCSTLRPDASDLLKALLGAIREGREGHVATPGDIAVIDPGTPILGLTFRTRFDPQSTRVTVQGPRLTGFGDASTQ